MTSKESGISRRVNVREVCKMSYPRIRSLNSNPNCPASANVRIHWFRPLRKHVDV